jgi:hypothetical protein
MAIQIQLRRGTTNQSNSFTGALGEITYNTTTGGVRTHDGSTLGGKELLLSDLSNIAGTIENASLANSTISGIALGNDLAALTIGTGLLSTAETYDGSTAVTVELDETGVTPGTYGSTLSVPVLDIDALGRVTGVTNVPITVTSGGSGGAAVTVSDVTPSSPSVGDMWWDSGSASLRIYYNDGDSVQWVDASPAIVGPTGEPGPAGPQGPQGIQGIQGPATPVGRQVALTMLFS